MYVLGNFCTFKTMETPRKRRRLATKDCEECKICSENVFEVCHPHISTRQSLLDKANHNGDSWCLICRQKHPVKQEERMKVVLGSSTLAHLWKTRTFSSNLKCHIDFDCIIGGQIHDVHGSFLDQYYDMSTPLDIVLACGVNNILTQDSVQTIVRSYQSFIKDIQRHGAKYSVTNRVVICPILYAPKYCDDRLAPAQNYLEKVFGVNQWIHRFNQSESGITMNLDQQGVISVPDGPSGGVRHDYSKWREPNWQRMLHMGREAQESAAKQLLEVFDILESSSI